MTLALLALLACHHADDTGSNADTVPPGCGDGVLDADEACDDGDGNSDTTPDACRTSCLLPTCGDGVTDAGEACDDGATAGGDGCSATCAVETGTLEVEPNETWDQATPAGAEADGSLPTGDVDCWSFDVPSCGAVSVHQEGPCGAGLALALHDPTGALVAVGSPGADGCAALDPADQPGARWVSSAGTWSVCASAVNGAPVDGYALAIDAGDATGLPPVGRDLDGDGLPDTCDADVDGDGVLDPDDDCPEVSNGPDTPPLALPSTGYVRTWLGAGPFTTGVTPSGCDPSLDAFVGEDGPIAPTVGSPAGDSHEWTAELLTTDSFDFLGPWGSVGSPREAYVLVYLRSDTARTLTLAVGADDGVRGWWNGEQVLDVSSCQGVVPDQFQVPVDVAAGWNTLLLKVYDQWGGWGVTARLLDNGVAVTDLEPSLAPGESWAPGQEDADGDGLGDVCDPDP